MEITRSTTRRGRIEKLVTFGSVVTSVYCNDYKQISGDSVAKTSCAIEHKWTYLELIKKYRMTRKIPRFFFYVGCCGQISNKLKTLVTNFL